MTLQTYLFSKTRTISPSPYPISQNSDLGTSGINRYPFILCGVLLIIFWSQVQLTATARSNPLVDLEGSSENISSLNIATWNLNRLTAQDTHRIQGIADRLEQSGLHLIALQEVEDHQTLQHLLAELQDTRYKGFIAAYIPYNLRLAYLYDSGRIDSLDAGPLPTADVTNVWANRLPFTFSFSVQADNQTIKITAINIHAKADIPDRWNSYQKRLEAAEELYRYASNNFTSERLIILGDFNDDLDESIFRQHLSPYYLFEEDNFQYQSATGNLSTNSLSTTLFNDEPIDHILLNREIFHTYTFNPARRHSPLSANSSTEDPDTLSDHYIVKSTINFNRSTKIKKDKPVLFPANISEVHNAPNPLSNSTYINFKLQKSERISITIYNLAGRIVDRVTRNRPYMAGTHSIRWNTNPQLSAGVYRFRLKASGGGSINRLITVIR